MASGQQDASSLLAEGLVGKGRVWLNKLDIDVLRELAAACDGGVVPLGDVKSASREDMVGAVCRWKNRQSKKEEGPASERPSVARSPAPAPAPAPASAAAASGAGVLAERADSVLIYSFNALKLRIDAEDLQGEWEGLLLIFARADVVVMQEVPAETAVRVRRVQRVLQRLKDASGSEWTVTLSAASGPGPLEVHALFCKAPLTVDRSTTLATAAACTLAHAPLVVALRGGALRDMELVLTSVHLPPKAKERQRDAQLRSLCDLYRTSACARLSTPLTDEGAKSARRAPTVHVLAGDWNLALAHEAARPLVGDGFDVLLGTGAKTTSGRQQFDNFLVSRNTRNHFEIGSGVLRLSRLQNLSQGVRGLSDHSPIWMSLRVH